MVFSNRSQFPFKVVIPLASRSQISYSYYLAKRYFRWELDYSDTKEYIRMTTLHGWYSSGLFDMHEYDIFNLDTINWKEKIMNCPN